MDTVVLGRTGLEVSVAGLGCGGHSRLGQSYGASADESIAVVRRAVDLGVTYVDTAQAYGTEDIVGRALEGRRREVVLSTKVSPRTRGGDLLDEAGLRDAVHESLRTLRTEWIDVYHLHGVGADEYDECVERLVPVLQRLRDDGVVRFLAVSERFVLDPGHEMLQRAVQDDCWDVMMVGFNPLNQSARARVLHATTEQGIGVEVMFAVRRALSRPDELASIVRALVDEGRVPGDGTGTDAPALDPEDALGFLVHEGGASSVVDASYRFARHEPGCDVILTGTGNIAHLEQNVRSINAPPLPAGDVARIRRVFGHLDHLTGN